MSQLFQRAGCLSTDDDAAGAELANVLNEAALETVRRRGDLVSKADIYNGMDRILQVLQSRPRIPVACMHLL